MTTDTCKTRTRPKQIWNEGPGLRGRTKMSVIEAALSSGCSVIVPRRAWSLEIDFLDTSRWAMPSILKVCLLPVWVGGRPQISCRCDERPSERSYFGLTTRPKVSNRRKLEYEAMQSMRSNVDPCTRYVSRILEGSHMSSF